MDWFWWVLLGAAYLFMWAAVSSCCNRKWKSKEADLEVFFCGLFWPITVLCYLGFCFADWLMDKGA